MDKLDSENILKNAELSDEQVREFAYGITAEMVMTYVNEHQEEYEEWLKKEKNKAHNKN